ncbi:homoserine dehydrogenase-domain-containing protein [Russula vinacea]|nr:homoserine dehydrogenase-domain-containing protein [Russula vinacea]
MVRILSPSSSRFQRSLTSTRLTSSFPLIRFTHTTMSSKIPKTVSVAVVGVGGVGSEFVRQLQALQPPHPFRLISLSSSKATVFNPDGIPPSATGKPSSVPPPPPLRGPRGGPPAPARAARARRQCVVFVDNTAAVSVAETYPALLRAGVHVVTPNKKAFSASQALYDQIVVASREGGANFCMRHCWCWAACPLDAQGPRRDGGQGHSDRGCLLRHAQLHLQRILYWLRRRTSFSTVVRIARDKGYTEPHPADDLNGADVARKLTILTRLLSSPNQQLPDGYASVPTSSLIPPTLALSSVPTGDAFLDALQAHDSHFGTLRAEAARGGGAVLRYVGVIDIDSENGSISVKASLERYASTHPFATSLGGSDNIIMFHTERYGARPLIIQGAGAGAAVTAMGVLSDVLKLA